MDVADVGSAVGDGRAKIVGQAVGDPAPDAAAGHPGGEGGGVMIPAVRPERGPAKLPRPHDEGLAQRFFRAAAKVIDAPWQLAVSSDLALPNVPGARPLSVRIVNAYIARLQRVATHDPKVSAAFIRVIHLVAALASLFMTR